MFIPNKLISINNNVDKLISLPETADKTFTYVTKVTGATTRAVGVECQDDVCAVVSTIGVTADRLQICTSFIPGPNVTAIITTSVSVGCKVFVWCCKRPKFLRVFLFSFSTIIGPFQITLNRLPNQNYFIFHLYQKIRPFEGQNFIEANLS